VVAWAADDRLPRRSPSIDSPVRKDIECRSSSSNTTSSPSARRTEPRREPIPVPEPRSTERDCQSRRGSAAPFIDQQLPVFPRATPFGPGASARGGDRVGLTGCPGGWTPSAVRAIKDIRTRSPMNRSQRCKSL